MSLDDKVVRTKGRNKESLLLIRKDSKISDANYGEITELDAVLQRNGRERPVQLIRKKYKGLDSSDAKIHRDKAITAYQHMKKVGVENIPNTFRPHGEDEILMTDFNVGGNIALAANKLEKPRAEKIRSLTNFEEMILEIAPDIVSASKNGITLDADSFFLVVPREGQDVKGKIVIGDFEGIHAKRDQKWPLDESSIRDQLYKNIGNIAIFFNTFLRIKKNGEVFADESLHKQYHDEAHRILQEYASDHLVAKNN